MADQDRANSAIRNLRGSLIACLLLTAAAACGGGGDDDGSGPADNAGGKSGSASGGRGGDTAITTSGSGGLTTPPPPEPVSCGSTMCFPPSNPLAGLLPAGTIPTNILPMSVPCCVDADSGRCGTAPSAEATCEPPAVSDARCPGLMLTLGGLGGAGMNMPGCCIDNMCGLDGALFGRGCLENSQASSMLSGAPLIGMFVRAPPSLACDRPIEPPPTTNDRDAGADDAGI